MCVTLVPSSHAAAGPGATSRAAVASGAGDVHEAIFLTECAPYNASLVVTFGASYFGVA